MGHRSDQPEARLARLAVFAMRARCAHLPGVFGHLRVRAVAAARRAGPGVPGLSRGVASVERTEVASEAHDGDVCMSMWSDTAPSAWSSDRTFSTSATRMPRTHAVGPLAGEAARSMSYRSRRPRARACCSTAGTGSGD